jgi:hypothetical protein
MLCYVTRLVFSCLISIVLSCLGLSYFSSLFFFFLLLLSSLSFSSLANFSLFILLRVLLSYLQHAESVNTVLLPERLPMLVVDVLPV